MAVPSSGSLSMQDIACEKVFDNYNHPTDGIGASQRAGIGTISLADLSSSGNSNGSGTSFEANNTNNAASDRPDGSAPHLMSEFYSYDHDKTSTYSNTMTVGSFANNVEGVTETGYGYSNSTSNPGGGNNTDGSMGSMNSALSGFNGATLLNLYWDPGNVLIITFTGTKPSFNSLSIGGTDYGASSTWTSNGSDSWRKTQFGSPFGTTVGASVAIAATF